MVDLLDVVMAVCYRCYYSTRKTYPWIRYKVKVPRLVGQIGQVWLGLVNENGNREDLGGGYLASGYLFYSTLIGHIVVVDLALHLYMD